MNLKELTNEELADLLKDIREEVEARTSKWYSYIGYLHTWANEHSALESAGQSPACYDEWCDMEEDKLEED